MKSESFSWAVDLKGAFETASFGGDPKPGAAPTVSTPVNGLKIG